MSDATESSVPVPAPAPSTEDAAEPSQSAPVPTSAPTQPSIRVLLALTGNEYRRSFVLSLMAAMNQLWEDRRIQVILSPGMHTHTVHSRMQAWGIPPKRAIAGAVPMDGEFDILVSLGTNVAFRPDQLIELMEACLRIHPVVAGIVRGPTMEHVHIASSMDLSVLSDAEQWGYWTLSQVQEIQADLQRRVEAKEPVEVFRKVELASLDFLAVRRDVFQHEVLRSGNESIFEFPAAIFPKKIVRKNEQGVEETSLQQGRYVYTDDEAFCRHLARAGIPIHAHLGLLIGVEKPVLF